MKIKYLLIFLVLREQFQNVKINLANSNAKIQKITL